VEEIWADFEEEEELVMAEAAYQLANSEKLNPCILHLCQLAVLNVFNLNVDAKKLLKRVGDVTSFFHNSNHWHTELRSIMGVGVVPACKTRFSSHFKCFERTLLIRNGVSGGFPQNHSRMVIPHHWLL
jgi:hypothetical protein